MFILLLAVYVYGHGHMTYPPSTRHGGSLAKGGNCQNGACFWFSNNVEIPGKPTLPVPSAHIFQFHKKQNLTHPKNKDRLIWRKSAFFFFTKIVDDFFHKKKTYCLKTVVFWGSVSNGEPRYWWQSLWMNNLFKISFLDGVGETDVYKTSPWRAPGTAPVFG